MTSSLNNSTAAKPIEPADEPMSIAKPATSGLAACRSKKAAGIGGVETLPAALPHHKISDAKDFVRLHDDDEKYWSPEYCFVSVPVEGAKPQLHLIADDLAEPPPRASASAVSPPVRAVAVNNAIMDLRNIGILLRTRLASI